MDTMADLLLVSVRTVKTLRSIAFISYKIKEDKGAARKPLGPTSRKSATTGAAQTSTSATTGAAQTSTSATSSSSTSTNEPPTSTTRKELNTDSITSTNEPTTSADLSAGKLAPFTSVKLSGGMYLPLTRFYFPDD